MKRVRNGYIAAVFLALLPQTVFRQAIVWTSGFSNYVTSIFLTLIYIVYVNQIIDMQVKPHESTLRSVLFLALGAVNAMIVEHMTAYNIVLSVSICVYLFYKYHKWCMQSLMYCGGGIFRYTYYAVKHSISQCCRKDRWL